jgi:hypothetical protein
MHSSWHLEFNIRDYIKYIVTYIPIILILRKIRQLKTIPLGTENMTQALQHLPSKHEVLSLNSSITKTNKQTNKKQTNQSNKTILLEQDSL